MFANECQCLVEVCDFAFELSVFGGFEHGFEFGAGAVACGDEVVACEERFGSDGFGGS